LTACGIGPIIVTKAKALDMSDPNRDRSIHRMTWIAFILAAITGLLSIIFVRPLPVDDSSPIKVLRSP
jgi:hypothetical protein